MRHSPEDYRLSLTFTLPVKHSLPELLNCAGRTRAHTEPNTPDYRFLE